MTIKIYNVYSKNTNTFHGEPEQIKNQLTEAYGFLSRYGCQTLQDVLQQLSQQQSLMLEVTE
jgi:hypothetical protein